MSIHLGAKAGEIAETVLLPGDPLRAKFIAENLLEDAKCYTQVRGMLGFTGTYKGKQVSVQGTGMGIPSISIYVNELIQEYSCKNLIRIGTCGSFQEHIGIREVILAMSACTDSAVNRLVFQGMDFAPTADFNLLLNAYQSAIKKGIPVHVGSVLTTDSFYHGAPERRKIWPAHGVLAGEMETAALYTLAARYQAHALSILTVSDARLSGQTATSQEREQSFTQMVEIALEIV